MIVFGYAKQYKYTSDGTLLIQVRIPSIHGPYVKSNADGKSLKTYTSDDNLPWIYSLVLPHPPADGEVVAVASLNDTSSQWLVIGLTGGQYSPGIINMYR